MKLSTLIFTLLIVIILENNAYSQKLQGEYMPSHLMSFDLGGIFSEHRISLEYEHLFSGWTSSSKNMGMGIGINYFLKANISDVDVSGIGIFAFPRFYTAQEAPRGFWLGLPYVGVANMNFDYFEEHGSGIALVFGGMTGYNFLFGRMPCKYLSLGLGYGYVSSEVDITGYGKYSMTGGGLLFRLTGGLVF